MDIKKIREDIKNDPRNIQYTKVGKEPIFQLNKASKILIIGQAPGKKVEETGILFNDKSGDKLANWLGIEKDNLYEEIFSIIPMDFYYPGKAKTGDKSPRKFIANEYHPILLKELSKVELTILVGAYAQKHYLKGDFKKNLTQTVKSFEKYLPEYFPIVHPSPLNNRWLSKNPFFEEKVVPELRKRVINIL